MAFAACWLRACAGHTFPKLESMFELDHALQIE
jgi:hypothetical protein